MATSSLVNSVYFTVQELLKGILDESVLYENEDLDQEKEMVKVYQKDATVLYHLSNLTSYKHKE